MRRLKPDPIPYAVQARILDAAIRAPSGGNSQSWRFLLVDDAALRARLAPIYQDCLARLWDGPYASAQAAAKADPEQESSRDFFRMQRSAQYLADHFADVLALLGVPADRGWAMTCCVTFGYPLGHWGVAPRRPVHEVAFRNRWGEAVGFEVPAPLWP